MPQDSFRPPLVSPRCSGTPAELCCRGNELAKSRCGTDYDREMFHVEHWQDRLAALKRLPSAWSPASRAQIDNCEFLSLDWSFALFRTHPLLPLSQASSGPIENQLRLVPSSI
jgi:hypothetical protein